MLFVSVTLDRETGELLSPPDFVSRGFLQNDSNDAEDLFVEAVRKDSPDVAATR